MNDEQIVDTKENFDTNKYSKRSFFTFFISLFAVLFSLMLTFFSTNSTAPFIVAIIFIISTALGLFFMIKSLTRKEPNSFMKIVGIIGNSINLMIFLGLISFILMDMFG